MTIEQFLGSYWAYGLMFACLLPSLYISLFTLVQHLLHYTTPRLQSYVVRILVLLPIYGGELHVLRLNLCLVLTWTLWMFPKFAEIIDMLRNLWEGLLIHSFLCLMMEYCGGESACGAAISRDPAVIRHTWPISKLNIFGLNQDIPLNVGFVRKCRLGTMQYAFVRPLLSIISIILQPFGATNTRCFRLVYNLLINASVYLALYILTLFYMALRKQPGLAKANVIAKFFSLKFFVVCTFYQTYAIVCFSPLDYDVGLNFGAFLVICELPIFAILQRIAYDVNEFQGYKGGGDVVGLALGGFGNRVEIDLETFNTVGGVDGGAVAGGVAVADGVAGVAVVGGSGGSLETFRESGGAFGGRKVTVASVLGYHREDVQMATSRMGMALVMKNASLALDITDLFKDLYYSCSERYRRHSPLDSADYSADVGGSSFGTDFGGDSARGAVGVGGNSADVVGVGGGDSATTRKTKSIPFENFANFNFDKESAGAFNSCAETPSKAAPTFSKEAAFSK